MPRSLTLYTGNQTELPCVSASLIKLILASQRLLMSSRGATLNSHDDAYYLCFALTEIWRIKRKVDKKISHKI